MKSISSAAAIAVVSFWFVIAPVGAQQPTVSPAAGLSLKTPVEYGCYSSPGNMLNMGPYTFQTSGWCQALCVRLAKPYMALFNGDTCFCGDSAPSQSDKIDDDSCKTPCKGFLQDTCMKRFSKAMISLLTISKGGGPSGYFIYGDGYTQGDPTGSIKINIPPQTTTNAAATSTAKADTVESQIKVPSTVFVTQSGVQKPSVIYEVTQTATPQTSSEGPNKAAIAAGVAVAVVVVAAIVGAVFFIMRHKKNKALEEERRRHQAMTALATGEKPPSTYSLADSRLEPNVMFQRRQSDGSIMDNHDYSRRILKVKMRFESVEHIN